MTNELTSNSRINELKGDVCIIGVKQAVLIGAVTYDVIVNIYLTILFLVPLSSKYCQVAASPVHNALTDSQDRIRLNGGQTQTLPY